MAWSDIDLYKVSQLADDTTMDTLRTNIEYLHSPNISSYQHPGTGSDYSITGEIGVDMDGTNFALNLTTYGGLVMALFYGVASVSAGSLRMNIVRNNPVSFGGRNLFNSWSAEIVKTVRTGIAWMQPFPGLPAGTHEFRVVWGVSNGTGTMHVIHRPTFVVVEI